MKKYSIIIFSLLFIVLAGYSSNYSDEFKLAEEDYIDDIPFDTEEIYNTLADDDDLVNFILEDEAYIDDIPFDTELVVQELQMEDDLKAFALNDEGYIDDIPFDTEAIAYNILMQEIYNEAFAAEFDLEEEEYIDDITFDTYDVVASLEKDNNQEADLIAQENHTAVEEAGIAASFEIRDILIPVLVVIGIMSYLFYAYVV